MFEGDIKVVGKMVSYIENSYEKPYREINEDVQLTAGTAELPLWKMYNEEKNYILPYLIDKSIGKIVLLTFIILFLLYRAQSI